MRRRKQPTSIGLKRIRVAGLLLVLAAGAAALALRAGPTDRLRLAEAALATDPAAADALAARAIEQAGGDFPDAQLLRSRALVALRRGDEALGSFGLIRSPQRCDQQALVDLAAEAQAAGENLLARLALEAANRSGALRAEVLKRLILLGLDASSSDEVLAHCKLLESLRPDDPFAWQTEARLRRARKQALAALPAYRRALQLEHDERTRQVLRGELAGVLLDLGALTEARKIIDDFLGGGDAPPDLLMKHAYLSRLEGRPEEALNAIERVLAEAPSPAARMLQGIVQLDAGRFSEAAANFKRVVAEQPRNKEAHYKLSQAYTKLGETEHARMHMEKCQRLTREAVASPTDTGGQQ